MLVAKAYSYALFFVKLSHNLFSLLCLTVEQFRLKLIPSQEILTTENEMSTGSTSSNSGIGFTGLLTILFIGLKLTNYIDWSWWWVLSPLWIGMAIALAIVSIVIVLAAISK